MRPATSRAPVLRPDGTYAIPLTQGAFAIIDAVDLPLVQKYKWHLSAKGYARHTYRIPGANRKKVGILMMHQLIFGALPGVIVDHESRDRLDNRRHNLRKASFADNSRNAISANQKRGLFRGVSKTKGGAWKAVARVGIKQADGKRKAVNLGTFATAEGAALAYDAAARECFGQFAVVNFQNLEKSA